MAPRIPPPEGRRDREGFLPPSGGRELERRVRDLEVETPRLDANGTLPVQYIPGDISLGGGGLPDGTALGDLLVWDGAEWQFLAREPSDGLLLTTDTGSPVGVSWQPPADLTPVIVPDGFTSAEVRGGFPFSITSPYGQTNIGYTAARNRRYEVLATDEVGASFGRYTDEYKIGSAGVNVSNLNSYTLSAFGNSSYAFWWSARGMMVEFPGRTGVGGALEYATTATSATTIPNWTLNGRTYVPYDGCLTADGSTLVMVGFDSTSGRVSVATRNSSGTTTARFETNALTTSLHRFSIERLSNNGFAIVVEAAVAAGLVVVVWVNSSYSQVGASYTPTNWPTRTTNLPANKWAPLTGYKIAVFDGHSALNQAQMSRDVIVVSYDGATSQTATRANVFPSATGDGRMIALTGAVSTGGDTVVLTGHIQVPYFGRVGSGYVGAVVQYVDDDTAPSWSVLWEEGNASGQGVTSASTLAVGEPHWDAANSTLYFKAGTNGSNLALYAYVLS